MSDSLASLLLGNALDLGKDRNPSVSRFFHLWKGRGCVCMGPLRSTRRQVNMQDVRRGVGVRGEDTEQTDLRLQRRPCPVGGGPAQWEEAGYAAWRWSLLAGPQGELRGPRSLWRRAAEGRAGPVLCPRPWDSTVCMTWGWIHRGAARSQLPASRIWGADSLAGRAERSTHCGQAEG